MLRYLPMALLLVPAFACAEAHPFDVDDLVRLNRVSDPQLRPDGKALVYTQRETDFDANKGLQSLWQLSLDGASQTPRRLTSVGSSAMHARYSPDGKRMYFLSSRGGSMQVWMLGGPGEAQPVTELPLDVGDFMLSPDGKHLALALEVYPECGTDFSCTKTRADADEAEIATGTTHERLFIRHWSTWHRGTRSQLFVMNLDADGKTSGEPWWASRGIDGDVPTKPFGDLAEVAFTPDSRQIVFTARIAGASEAWSTNTDLYLATIGNNDPAENLTPEYPGYDTAPAFSPDGKKLYWNSMARAGYEADRNRILERDLASKSVREVAPEWDRSPDGLTLSADGRTLYSSASDIGQRLLFAIDVKTGKVRRLTTAGSIGGFAVGKQQIYATIDALNAPADIYAISLKDASRKVLTAVNADRLQDIQFGQYEQFSFKGWNDETVYGWVVKPADYVDGQRYPVAFIVHGGPQGSMGNSFHYRWNPQTYAGKGFAVVFIDFHGSTGYGQAFTDSIRGDWGGKPLVDLKKGMAAARERYAFLDSDRACAIGASYGGYMMNWIAGNWPEGFRCIVNHAGIFDNRFMGYTTEELWFNHWEMEGTPYEKPENYEKHNPVNHVTAWKTPMMVTHGMLDFRVPFEQGIAAFTALQRRGIPSKFMWFPDENHWILKPHNSVQWHRAVEAWLQQWTTPESR